MKRTLLIVAIMGFLVAGCGEAPRYGTQVDSQTQLDASRTQDAVIVNVLKDSNQISSLLMNGKSSAFDQSQLKSVLTAEMGKTQDAMNTLEQYRQPTGAKDDFQRGFTALVDYKASLQYLYQAVSSGKNLDGAINEYHTALSALESSYYVKP